MSEEVPNNKLCLTIKASLHKDNLSSNTSQNLSISLFAVNATCTKLRLTTP